MKWRPGTSTITDEAWDEVAKYFQKARRMYMSNRPIRMSEQAKYMERENRIRTSIEQSRRYTTRPRLMPDYEARYYAEEVSKYGSIPEELTESQVAQVLKMMKEESA